MAGERGRRQGVTCDDAPQGLSQGLGQGRVVRRWEVLQDAQGLGLHMHLPGEEGCSCCDLRLLLENELLMCAVLEKFSKPDAAGKGTTLWPEIIPFMAGATAGGTHQK